MTISKDLFLALLSMDAYNRGYGAGLTVEGSDAIGTQIGDATIIGRSSSDEKSDAVKAGFYAVAYKTTKDIGTTETGGVIPAGTTLIAA